MKEKKEIWKPREDYLMSMNEALNERVEDYKKLETQHVRQKQELERELAKEKTIVVGLQQSSQKAVDKGLVQEKAALEAQARVSELEECLAGTEARLRDFEDRARADFADQLDTASRDLRVRTEEL